MGTLDRQKHWEKVYETKEINEVSWFQEVPSTSLEFIKDLDLAETSGIIDIGGGDGFLVDNLISLGLKDISVLDISGKAINRAQKRLGSKARSVKWIIADVVGFQPERKYDFWHDRATFHFLTDEKEIKQYVKTLESGIKPGGYLLIGTFSDQGPEKCSGLDVRQYSQKSLTDLLKDSFSPVRYITQDHTTPSGSIQNFLFGLFKRNEFY